MTEINRSRQPASSGVETLSSLRIPAALGLARRPAVPPEYRGENYGALYDVSTLFYDAVHLPAAQKIVLFCPKLFNLEPLIRQGRFSSGEGPLRLARIVHRRRYDEVWLVGASIAGTLEYQWRDWSTSLALSRQDDETFAGLNCILAISKNNKLEWIRDWLHYHVCEHGLEGLVLFDNQSDEYGMEALAEAVDQVAGIKAFKVVSAPFSYGPKGIKRKVSRSKYLQTSLLNIARIRYFSRAAAVLSIDVDELVHSSRAGLTVFEEARSSRFGYTAFRGAWLFDTAGDNALPLHRNHWLAQEEGGRCPYKYCVVPQSPIGRLAREVHGVAASKLLNFLFESKHMKYWHFWNINTNWKGHRTRGAQGGLTTDESARRTLLRVFPAENA